MTGYMDMAPAIHLILEGFPDRLKIPIRINIESKPLISDLGCLSLLLMDPGTDLSRGHHVNMGR